MSFFFTKLKKDVNEMKFDSENIKKKVRAGPSKPKRLCFFTILLQLPFLVSGSRPKSNHNQFTDSGVDLV